MDFVYSTIDTNYDTIDTNSGTISDTIAKYFTVEESSIIKWIKVDATLTQKKLQEKTGYSIRTVKRIMAKLQKEGVITRIGNNRSGKWQVNK